jgi:hypothetical protein
VTLTRPKEGTVRAKSDGRMVVICRFVRYFDPFHNQGGEIIRAR